MRIYKEDAAKKLPMQGVADCENQSAFIFCRLRRVRLFT